MTVTRMKKHWTRSSNRLFGMTYFGLTGPLFCWNWFTSFSFRYLILYWMLFVVQWKFLSTKASRKKVRLILVFAYSCMQSVLIAWDFLTTLVIFNLDKLYELYTFSMPVYMELLNKSKQLLVQMCTKNFRRFVLQFLRCAIQWRVSHFCAAECLRACLLLLGYGEEIDILGLYLLNWVLRQRRKL